MLKPFSGHASFHSVIQHFTPNWFAVNMGTGITALCLGSLPGTHSLIHQIACGLWLINAGLFCLFFALWLTSLACYPRNHLELLKHSSLPFFLGCLPMGMTTVVNGFILFGLPLWGPNILDWVMGLWYLNAALSFLVVIIVPYFMFSEHQHELENMTAVWLLPFVAAEVSASSAGIIAVHLSPAAAYPLVILGYMLWGISLPLAFIIIVIFFQRLAVHKLPVKEVGATMWLPLGPISMGALGLMTLGRAADQMIQNGHTALWLSFMHPLGIIGAIILLGFSTWIAAMAFMITMQYIKKGLPYNMSFWSFTFPLGVYTLSNLTLGADTGITLFKVYGSILTFILLFVWVWVSAKTLPGLYHGSLIKNPLIK